MALALVLRNYIKINGLKPILRNARQFTQLSAQPAKLNLATNIVKPNINRNIALTAPRLSAHGNHTTLWNVERALSLGLLGLIPAALVMPCGLFDNLLAVSLVAHQHWGLEACVIDYIRPIVFGAAIPKLALGLLYVASVLTLGGLLYFNYHDIGLGRAVRKFWSLKQ